jgi:O-antigen/teichoic acid export membrane protein
MNLKKILGDALVSSVKLFVSILRGIVLIPIITKTAGESVYGTWVVLLAIVSIVSAVGSLHLHGTLIRYRPRETQEGQTLVDILALGLLIAGVVAFVTFILISRFGLLPQVENPVAVLYAVVAVIVSRIVFLILKNYPRACNKVKTYESIELAQLLLEGVFIAFAFWLYGSVLLGLWSLAGVSMLLSVPLMVAYLPRELRLPDVTAFGKYLRYGVPMVPKEMGRTLLTNADKYILNVLISPTAVAVYAVSYKVAQMIRNITTPLNSTLYPEISRAWEAQEMSEIGSLYRKIFTWYTLLGIPAVIGISILAEPLLAMLSTQAIADQGRYILPPLALGFYLRGYDNTLEYIFNAAEENSRLAKITIVASVLNVVLNLAAIPPLGIFGAVVASLVSQAIVLAYIYTYARKKVELPLPVGTVLKSLASALIMGGILVLQPVSLSGIYELVMLPILGVLIYVAVLLAMGGISVAELRGITSFVRS